ncbi:MAG: FHA domain-containing protein [Acidimicrobiales bacterium]|nr:FHA domain-containing protein [Acidimicrobiales bacterium]
MSGQRLTIRFEGQDHVFEPASSPVRIGRDEDADVVVERQGVSRHHAQLDYDGESWQLRDVDSTQGTFVEGERVTTRPVGDSLSVTLARGEHAVRLEISTSPIVDELDRTVAASPDATAVVGDGGAVRPGGVLAAGAAEGATQVTGETVVVECAGQSYTFSPGRKYVIGRDSSVDVQSQNPNVSRRHAVLEYENGWKLADLDSSGGTFLDGRRTKETPISGTMAFVLGDADAGERVVVKASGVRQITLAQRFSRLGGGGKVGLLAGGLAALAIIIGAVAFLATRGDDDPDFDALTRGVVAISVQSDSGVGGTGSGTIIDKERGLVLTNAHVAGWGDGQGLALWYGINDTWFEDIEDITISVSSGLDRSAEPRFKAELVAVDGYLDLALLQLTETLSGKIVEAVDLAELTEVPLGTVEGLSTGDDVFAMGFPGVAANSAVTLTDGSISAFVVDERLEDNRGWIQMDLEIRGGNSGGLLTDGSGKLIGVPSRSTMESVLELRPQESGIFLSRAADYAQPMVDAFVAGETYVSPYVTLLDGSEDVTGVFFGELVEAEPGFTFECSDNFASTAPVGAQALAVQVDYFNFVAGAHQDLAIIVKRLPISAAVQQAYQDAGVALPDRPNEEGFAGAVQTPWETIVPRIDDCFTAAVPLQEPLLQLVDYVIEVRAGGNFKLMESVTFQPVLPPG